MYAEVSIEPGESEVKFEILQEVFAVSTVRMITRSGTEAILAIVW